MDALFVDQPLMDLKIKTVENISQVYKELQARVARSGWG